MKRFLTIIIAAFIFLMEPMAVHAQATVPYDTYIFNSKGDVVHTPAAYIPSGTIRGKELPCGSFNAPQDMFIAEGGTMYVADTGNNRIVVLSSETEVLEIIDSFINEDNKEDAFNTPSGVYCTNNGDVYIADTNNRRIVVLDKNQKLVKIISNPQSDALGDDFTFVPLKVAVDYAGRVYVICSNVYQGILSFDQESEFMGYFGTINVTITPTEIFWRIFSTKEQRARQLQYIPTEFTGIDIDEEGFVYATNFDSTGSQAVRMLNPKGIDVIKKSSGNNSSLGGDMRFMYTGNYSGASEIVDVKIRENGIYSILDNNRGRVFTYDSEGNLLYIFGGLGTQEGTFNQPVAIEAYDGLIYVLDAYRNAVFVFEPTQYGQYINEAVGLRFMGDQTAAVETWKKVLELDSNNEMAYVGIGKSYLSIGDNKTAMYYLKMGENKEYYSIAFKRYRNDLIRDNLSWILTTALFVGVLLYCVKKAIMKRKRRIR